MKKVLAIMMALCMVFALVACGAKTEAAPAAEEAAPAAEAAAAEKTIAVVLKTLNSEYWGYVKDGCDKAAAELGITVDVTGPDAESNIEGQVAMLETAIASHDAIVCAPNDATAANNVLKDAVAAGKPVLAVDTRLNLDGETCFVGTMNDIAAKQGALWAAKQVGEGAKAVIIYGQEGDNTSNLRMEGYEAGCAESGIEVLDKVSGNNTTDGAVKAMEAMLSAHPGEIDVVFCHNDDTAIGCANACEAAGETDVIIVGFDGNASALELIKAGNSCVKATVAQQPTEMGYQVVKAAWAALNGETVEKEIAADVIVKDATNVG